MIILLLDYFIVGRFYSPFLEFVVQDDRSLAIKIPRRSSGKRYVRGMKRSHFRLQPRCDCAWAQEEASSAAWRSGVCRPAVTWQRHTGCIVWNKGTPWDRRRETARITRWCTAPDISRIGHPPVSSTRSFVCAELREHDKIVRRRCATIG